jgi:arabinofuranosyltransferase
VPWAIVCALWLRVPYRNAIDPRGLADERGVHAFHIRPHPVLLSDYDIAHTFYDGRALRRLALDHRGLVLGDGITADRPPPPEVPLARNAGAPIVAPRLNVGILGYAAGPRVHVVDRLGLGDAIGARMRVVQRSRPGHEKWLSDAWVVARFADPAAPLPPDAPAASIVGAARAALACPPLAELVRAIEAPLTPAVFVHNVAVAWRLRNLEIAADPRQAAAELCEPR